MDNFQLDYFDYFDEDECNSNNECNEYDSDECKQKKNKKTLYTPQKLNEILLTHTKMIANDFKNIVVTGDIIGIHVWKRSGMSFKLSSGGSIINCKVWTRDGLDVEDIVKYENKKCEVIGDIEADFYHSHSFNLRAKEIVAIGSESKIDKLKKICVKRGYFQNKKPIVWDKVKRIGMISKKNTQGYNDFMKQFKLPISIKLKEIALDGPDTCKQSINAINKLQSVDIIIFVRGGGSTTDISNSYDKLELYNAIKQSEVPIITAIGHENDKGDKLLITEVSDLDYSTPSSASYEITKIMLKPVINKLDKLLDEIQNIFERKHEKMMTKEYNKLECLLTSFIRNRFGGQIVNVEEEEKYIIIQKGNKFYKNNIIFDEVINLTQEDIDNRQNILKGLDNNDIVLIKKFFNNFNAECNLSDNIMDSIKQVEELEVIGNKFRNAKSKKIKKLYCYDISPIKKNSIKKLCNLKKMVLWYFEVFEKMNDDNKIKKVYDFINCDLKTIK